MPELLLAPATAPPVLPACVTPRLGHPSEPPLPEAAELAVSDLCADLPPAPSEPSPREVAQREVSLPLRALPPVGEHLREVRAEEELPAWSESPLPEADSPVRHPAITQSSSSASPPQLMHRRVSSLRLGLAIKPPWSPKRMRNRSPDARSQSVTLSGVARDALMGLHADTAVSHVDFASSMSDRGRQSEQASNLTQPLTSDMERFWHVGEPGRSPTSWRGEPEIDLGCSRCARTAPDAESSQQGTPGCHPKHGVDALGCLSTSWPNCRDCPRQTAPHRLQKINSDRHDGAHETKAADGTPRATAKPITAAQATTKLATFGIERQFDFGPEWGRGEEQRKTVYFPAAPEDPGNRMYHAGHHAAWRRKPRRSPQPARRGWPSALGLFSSAAM